VAGTALLAGTVFAAVRHAEAVAARVGQSFGSLVLAVSVAVVEVAPVASWRSSPCPSA
jgi:Ca2+:H+ antiporter